MDSIWGTFCVTLTLFLMTSPYTSQAVILRLNWYPYFGVDESGSRTASSGLSSPTSPGVQPIAVSLLSPVLHRFAGAPSRYDVNTDASSASEKSDADSVRGFLQNVMKNFRSMRTKRDPREERGDQSCPPDISEYECYNNFMAVWARLLNNDSKRRVYKRAADNTVSPISSLSSSTSEEEEDSKRLPPLVASLSLSSSSPASALKRLRAPLSSSSPSSALKRLGAPLSSSSPSDSKRLRAIPAPLSSSFSSWASKRMPAIPAPLSSSTSSSASQRKPTIAAPLSSSSSSSSASKRLPAPVAPLSSSLSSSSWSASKRLPTQVLARLIDKYGL